MQTSLVDNAKKPLYRSEIDGLRAVAIIAVLGNHFNPDLFPNGYLGVDIFFVISGYVITSSIAHRGINKFSEFIIGFYKRRVKRILPALIVYTLLTSLLTCIFIPQPWKYLQTGLLSLVGASNFQLIHAQTDYFGGLISKNPFLVTWSLAVEEQFYLAYPLLVYAAFRISRRPSPLNHSFFKQLLLIIIPAFLVSIIWWKDSSLPSLNFAYFMMPTRLWEISIGGMAFILFDKLYEPKLKHRIFIELTTALLAICILLIIAIPEKIPVIRATFSVAIITGIFISIVKSSINSRKILSIQPLVFTGLISYSLYLWHWTVISISVYTVGITKNTIFLQVALSFGLAILSYRLVENPLRKAKWARTDWEYIPIGLLAILSAVLPIKFLSRTVAENLYFGNERFRESKEVNFYGQHIDPCTPPKEFNSSYIVKCLENSPASTTFGAQSNSVYLIGDSYARNYMNSIRPPLEQRGYKFHYLTMGWGCAYLPRSIKVWEKVNCNEFNDQVTGWLVKNLKPGDLVVIGQNPSVDRTTNTYFMNIKNLAEKISGSKAGLIQLDGTVAPKESVQNCLKDRWSSFNPDFAGDDSSRCSLSRKDVIERFSKFDQLANKFTLAHTPGNWKYIRLRQGLCNKDDMCGMKTSNGKIIWVDNGHITEKAAFYLAPLFDKQLSEIKFVSKKID